MKNKKVVALIPARMQSSRFPGKPLKEILGLPLVEHVRRRALLSELVDEVVVATCDQEIMEIVQGYGGNVVMTADTHERCTDRSEEASYQLELDIAVIVSGDEPLFFPEVLDRLVQPMLEDETVYCTNLLSVIHDQEDLHKLDIVKAVLNQQNDIMFFSRSPIPYFRVQNNCPMYRQTGLAAFTKSFLSQFSKLSPTPMEVAESVDFLRILEHGYTIRGSVYDQITIGVDRPNDAELVKDILQNDQQQSRYYQKILNL